MDVPKANLFLPFIQFLDNCQLQLVNHFSMTIHFLDNQINTSLEFSCFNRSSLKFFVNFYNFCRLCQRNSGIDKMIN